VSADATRQAAAALRDRVRLCLFDQYGTLVDMQSGLAEAAGPFLRAKGWPGDPHAFVTWWRRTHFENSMIDALLQREHTSYREIGHRSVAWVLERAGIPYSMDEVRRLVAHIERLRPFPEVPAALARLERRYRLAVLSNGDPDMLEAGQRHHGLRFEALISAAAANAFKPHAATYATAARLLGLPPDEILFVASHAFDCIGAKAAGMRTAFVGRRGRPFGQTPHQPDLTAPDLAALADALA
jgi:2-haloacid dehalogenase